MNTRETFTMSPTACDQLLTPVLEALTTPGAAPFVVGAQGPSLAFTLSALMMTQQGQEKDAAGTSPHPGPLPEGEGEDAGGRRHDGGGAWIPAGAGMTAGGTWIPAFAGMTAGKTWIPACAGMTAEGAWIPAFAGMTAGKTWIPACAGMTEGVTRGNTPPAHEYAML